MLDTLKIEEIKIKLKQGELEFRNLPIVEQLNVEIAQVALNMDGSNLEFLAQQQQNNKELVKLAIQSNPNAYLFASMLLQKDEEIASLALSQECTDELLKEICYKFYTTNKEITKHIVQRSPYVYNCVKNFQFPDIHEILKD